MSFFTHLMRNFGQFIFGKNASPVKSNVAAAPPAVFRQYTMNYFDPAENSNKVWMALAYTDGLFETRFGRVRDGANLVKKQKRFASKIEAEREIEKKRREKIRKGYKDTVVLDNTVETTIRREKQEELSRIAAEQIHGAADDSVTAGLIKYLVEVNIHHITHSTSIKYNHASATFSTPLGVLTPEAVSLARDLINEIKNHNENETFETEERARSIRDYFQLVPRDFGVRIPPVAELLSTPEQIDEQLSILEALESAIRTDAPDYRRQKMFQCRLVKIPHTTADGRNLFRNVRKLFENTRNSRHHPATADLKMTALYEVEIDSMKTGFDKAAQQLGNVRADLWHGTKASNLLSILKQGLIIPPANAAHCTGRMFGNGIYTSLQSTKALNYATDYWNRSGTKGQRTFMFLCEVALGKTHRPRGFTGKFPARGTDSTWVEPGRAGVLNHECIVYDAAQINLKYLAEFGTN